MLKKIAFAAAGFTLLASPLIASADTISDIQAKIRELIAQVQQLKAQLAAPDTTQSPIDPICPQILRTLEQGIEGSDVKELQAYLGVSQTGYFGPMTARAVAAFQGEEGLTQIGIVGPMTRAAFARRCGWGNQNFSASPKSGQAPLSVSFSSWGRKDGNYSIDFGDGSNGAMTRGPMAACAEQQSYPTVTNCGKYSYSASRTYTANGTYVVKLIYQEPFVCDAPPGAACMSVVANPKVVGTVMIKVGSVAPSCPIYSPPNCRENEQLVGGGFGADGCELGPRCVPKTPTTPGAPTINGIDGPASIAAGATGMWTVRASVPNNTNTQLRYSVIWGDEGVIDQIRAFGSANAGALQTSGTFTHVYASAGVYRPTFTVSNTAGSAQTSASVVVGGGGDEDGGGGGGGGNSTFSASPTSGTAPLTVIFRSNIVNDLDSYSIDFGDGTNGVLQNNCQLGYGACGLPTANHAYTANGTYIAKLKQLTGMTASMPGTPIYNTIGAVTITVGAGGTSSGTFTATPKTGAPPLMVTFTGVGNSIYFGDDGPTLIASGDGSLGTVTHVYRSGGEYTATSDKRSVNISVAPDRLADWSGAFGGAGASSKLCVYNNRTYQSGTSVDVPVLSCGTFADYRKCGGAIAAQGATGPIITERYTCRNSQWFDSNNIPFESELVNATSCLASDGVTTVGNGQMIVQGSFGAAWTSDWGAYGKRVPTMKCDKGKWLNCDPYGNNCTQASAETNTNLANALTALESAIRAFIEKIGQ